MFGTFHVFLVLKVMLQPSLKIMCVTGRTTLVGKLVTGQTAPGRHSKFLSWRTVKRVQILNRATQHVGEKLAFGSAFSV